MAEAIEEFVADTELLTKALETVHETPIKGVLVIERPVHGDGRGFFHETFRKNEIEAVLGRRIEIVQGNHSRNESQGVLRGLHIAPWDKLIYDVSGRIQQVVVDTRIGSPTFGQFFSIELGDSPDPNNPAKSNRSSLFVPRGCANGYLVLSQGASYYYNVTAYWSPGVEKELRWNDPSLGIKWAIAEPILSERDKVSPLLRDLFSERSLVSGKN